MKQQKINIGWFYPDLMNTYGDTGNILAFTKRCEQRGIKVELIKLNTGFNEQLLNNVDFIFMGGAQDKQQELVAKDLKEKRETLFNLIKKGTPGLFICGAYQLLGKFYEEKNGQIIKGLNIIDVYTKNDKTDKRLTGDIIIKTKLSINDRIIIGFENHGGKTFRGKNVKPLGTVIKGFGNNGLDKTEGAIYKNIICSYMHGPLLPKNPDLTDYLIKLALKEKYNESKLAKIDDSVERQARKMIASTLGIVL